MAVVLKKDEKVKAVIEKMSNPEDIEEFKSLFKQMYPDDCAKIQKTYLAEERKDKKGKGHPMPPDGITPIRLQLTDTQSITRLS